MQKRQSFRCIQGRDGVIGCGRQIFLPASPDALRMPPGVVPPPLRNTGQWWGPDSRFVSFVPSGGRLCYTNCQRNVKSGQPCIMDGAKSTLFLDCSSHGAAVQCIVCFTVLVRPNKAWYNWQHCFPKCKYLSRHTAKAFMIKCIVEDAYFIKQNPSLLGKYQSNNHLDQWKSTDGSWPKNRLQEIGFVK